MPNRTFLMISLMLLVQLAFSQKNFVPGYIVRSGQDTIRGYIDDRGWDQNPNSISFSTEMESSPMKFTTNEILAFGLSQKIYQSAIVTIDKSAHQSSQISTGVTQQASVVDTVFLEVLLRGSINLFSLKDENDKLHFFTSEGSASPNELILKRIFTTQNNKTFIATIEVYKRDLKELTKECPDLDKNIDRIRYTEKDLSKFLIAYNACNGSSNSYVAVKAKTEFRFTTSVGASITKLEFKGSSGASITRYDYPISANSTFALGLNTVFPQNKKKWSIYTELQYRSYQTKYLTSAFDFSYLRLNAAYRYNYPQGSVRPFVQGGITYGITLKSKTTLSDYRKDEQGLFGGVGLKWNKFLVESRYESTNAMSVFNEISSFTRSVYVLLSYQL